jgi:hypothetical protein
MRNGLVALALASLIAGTAWATEKHRQVQLFAAPVTFDDTVTVNGALTTAGSTFNSITGGDASLDVAGQDAAQGGAIPIKGGDSSTAANAGGATSLVGGDPGATGVGGASSVVGGIGGATSGAGGAALLTGGAATAGNSAGGAATLAGGTGQGTSAGGATSLTSGASEDGVGVGPGASGAVTVASGAAGTETTGTAGASGLVTMESADGGLSTSGTGGDSGDIVVQTGAGGELSTAGPGAGGAAGDISILAGAGGADTEDVDGTGGVGGSIVITAGAGGAGGGTDGIGGNVILTPGVPGAGSGTNVPEGAIFLRAEGGAADPVQPLFRAQAVPQGDAAGVADLLPEDALAGIYVNTPAGSVDVDFPIGDDLCAAIPGVLQIGDSFDFTVINLGTTGQVITMVDQGGSGTVSIIGFDEVHPGVVAEGSGSGTFRIRFTGSGCTAGNGDWTAYRIN